LSDRDWWRDAVLYQVYVRSFADGNGDGIGDLRGLTGRLDHLAWLGVDAIWLSPIHPSPNADWGYDVTDYDGVHSELGTLDDLDTLIAEGHRRHIRVLLDLVPNHTSDRHPWFVDARSSRTAAHRDWYVWEDSRADGSPPNNWVSSFGGPAWTYDHSTGQCYLHHFLASQPDLNWWNAGVGAEFDGILKRWFDRGIAGVRIDVCHMIVKDRELRDNPPATEDDPPFLRLLGQRQVYDSGQPELHEVLRRWRAIAEAYDPPRLLLGETYVFDLADLASFYGSGNELALASRPAGAAGTSERFVRRYSCSSRSAARLSSITATRSACQTPQSRSAIFATRSASASGRQAAAATQRAPRWPGSRRREPASPNRAFVLGCRSGTTKPATSLDSARTSGRCSISVGT
jgi:alpha-glucosidase